MRGNEVQYNQIHDNTYELVVILLVSICIIIFVYFLLKYKLYK
jgi:hypothetical protein